MEAYFSEKKGPCAILGAPGGNPDPLRHALGRLGAPVWEAFSIKDRSTINVFVDTICDMVFDRCLIEIWMIVGSKFDHFGITFRKQ